VPELYTCGIWQVAPGSEEDFVSAWRDLAEWTVKHTPGAGAATLVQDTGQPNRFVSFGPWESAEAIDAWRALLRIPGTSRKDAGAPGGVRARDLPPAGERRDRLTCRCFAPIRTSNRMEAHLVGSGFTIEALRPEIQVV
jgi:hypothetical protein